MTEEDSHPEVRDLLRELAVHQTFELIPVLADEVPRGALGEGAHAQGRDPALGALQVEDLRLVSTGRPPLPAGPGWRLHQVLGSQGLSGGTTAAWLLHSLVSEVR